MRKGFKAPKNEYEKIFVGSKITYALIKSLEDGKYYKKSGRSAFIEQALVEKKANLDAQKELKKMKLLEG